MTWAEFKAEVEKAGVKDEDEIDWIDVGSYGVDYVIQDDANGHWSIS